MADLLEQYRAARAGAVLVDRSALGRLAIRGKDAIDLLHRLATNDLKGLRPGEGTAAVFTTAKGRILDLVSFHRLEDYLLCLTGEGRAGALRAWIDRYTFREEVNVLDLSASHGTLGIFGPRAAESAAGLFGKEATGRPRHHPSLVRLAGGGEGVLARTFPLGGEGFLLTAEAAALPLWRERLAGAAGLVVAEEECFEVLRIEAGLPRHGRELTEDYNPWEARLAGAISLSKGCYVGQEVIARLNTYKKVSRLLVRLRIEGARPPAAGSALLCSGQPAGTLTSAAAVPGEERVVALGYVRDEDAVAGLALEVAGEAGAPPAIVLGAAG